MGRQEEYDAKVSEKGQKEKAKQACEDRIADYDDQIERLEAAKEVLSEQKATFKQLKKKTDRLLESDLKWTGENFDIYKLRGYYVSEENQRYLDDSLDFVLDSLNRKITDLKNARGEERSILGFLASAIRDLATEIENWWN